MRDRLPVAGLLLAACVGGTRCGNPTWKAGTGAGGNAGMAGLGTGGVSGLGGRLDGGWDGSIFDGGFPGWDGGGRPEDGGMSQGDSGRGGRGGAAGTSVGAAAHGGSGGGGGSAEAGGTGGGAGRTAGGNAFPTGAAGTGRGGGGTFGAGGSSGAPAYLGCTFQGGTNRIVVAKRDFERDLCVNVVLSSPGTAPSGVMLPAGYGLEAAAAGPASACPSRSAPGTRASQVSGSVVSVANGGPQGSPSKVNFDLIVTFPPNDAGVPMTEAMSAQNLDVQTQCP